MAFMYSYMRFIIAHPFSGLSCIPMRLPELILCFSRSLGTDRAFIVFVNIVVLMVGVSLRMQDLANFDLVLEVRRSCVFDSLDIY